jgi:lipopolysaccharide transport system ATP-binding protein
MTDEIIQVENLSKFYRLGEINTGTLSHDLNRWWSKLKGKGDPYEKLDGSTDKNRKKRSGHIWSLRDVHFSVRRGEVFGIVGKNGAGKSTLLKLLSKITKPTHGCIRIDGRMASMLEVGTGFHPDLSGRENVYLNGAILGMRKKEIARKFDEILDFSGVEKFIDTPVKRYSSGMFVRLAFAVAAHLEQEILIIDEVLAVGDAEFQQKCLGKMEDVSRNQGRTVLFVSHNMSAVQRLCTRALLLEKGQTRMIGPVDKVLELYQETERDILPGVRKNLPENGKGCFINWEIEGKQSLRDSHSCYTGSLNRIIFTFTAYQLLMDCDFHLMIRYKEEYHLIHAGSRHLWGKGIRLEPGKHRFCVELAFPLNAGNYDMDAALIASNTVIDTWTPSTKLQILDHYQEKFTDKAHGILNIPTTFYHEFQGGRLEETINVYEDKLDS